MIILAFMELEICHKEEVMSDKKLLKASCLFFGLAVLLTSLVVLAQDVPGPIVDPQTSAEGFVSAIASHQWGLAIGFGLMLVVWIMRLLWHSLKSEYLPYVAVTISTLGTVGTTIVLDSSNWLGAILAGISAGLTACGIWDLFGIAKKKEFK